MSGQLRSLGVDEDAERLYRADPARLRPATWARTSRALGWTRSRGRAAYESAGRCRAGRESRSGALVPESPRVAIGRLIEQRVGPAGRPATRAGRRPGGHRGSGERAPDVAAGQWRGRGPGRGAARSGGRGVRACDPVDHRPDPPRHQDHRDGAGPRRGRWCAGRRARWPGGGCCTRSTRRRSCATVSVEDLVWIRHWADVGEHQRLLQEVPPRVHRLRRRAGAVLLGVGRRDRGRRRDPLADADPVASRRSSTTPGSAGCRCRTRRSTTRATTGCSTMLASGLKDEAIARYLGVSLRTVRRRVATLMEDLGAHTRFQLGSAGRARADLLRGSPRRVASLPHAHRRRPRAPAPDDEGRTAMPADRARRCPVGRRGQGQGDRPARAAASTTSSSSTAATTPGTPSSSATRSTRCTCCPPASSRPACTPVIGNGVVVDLARALRGDRRPRGPRRRHLAAGRQRQRPRHRVVQPHPRQGHRALPRHAGGSARPAAASARRTPTR